MINHPTGLESDRASDFMGIISLEIHSNCILNYIIVKYFLQVIFIKKEPLPTGSFLYVPCVANKIIYLYKNPEHERFLRSLMRF